MEAAAQWAAWGLADLTRPPAAPSGGAQLSPVERMAALLASVPGVDPAHILSWRARLQGWGTAGRTSVNGSCRLLAAADGWLAINLSRPTDLDLLPAVLERELTDDPWAELTTAAAAGPAGALAARAQLLGIPAAVLGGDAALPALRRTRPGESDLPLVRRAGPGVPALPAVRRTRAGAQAQSAVRRARPGAPDRSAVRRAGTGTPAPPGNATVVLDLSAMWAGPLCAQLLGRAGAQVVKVEDVRRPDGARFGPPEFYADLHAGHASVVLDFGTDEGRTALHALAAEADVVIESSRPRALRSLGLDAEEWLRARPGRTWISITGYGREDPANRVAFGDDAAVAGGLVAWTAQGTPEFCGDAVADPLTGVYAARAALESQADGGGHLLDIAMAGVAAEIAGNAPPC